MLYRCIDENPPSYVYALIGRATPTMVAFVSVQLLLLIVSPSHAQFLIVVATFRFLPRDFRPDVKVAAMDLMCLLLEPDPLKRGLNHMGKKMAHRYMLVHPFWWDARKAMSFLVVLGNYETPPVPRLAAAIDECLSKDLPRGTKTWVDHLDVALTRPKERPEYWKEPSTTAWGLLRFIRHCQIHLHDRGFDRDAKKLLLEPYFLDRFPSLVVSCWHVLLQCRESHAHITQSLLRPFLFDPVTPTLCHPEDSATWA
jgi:hypothetical protein